MGVLNDCGTLNLTRGDLSQARSCHQAALDIARQIGSPGGEATALTGLARCDQAAGNAAVAETGFRQALAIFQRIGAAESARVAAELNALTSAPGKELRETRTR
jgi:ATP/maltotriose-dependent transcriptional regulator MalT